MAKPTKHATQICAVLSAVALIGIVIGVVKQSPLVVILFLLPTVVYEVYRTEGKSTKWASWVLLIVLVIEALLITAGVSFDLAGFLGVSEATVAGYDVPLGDIKVVGPSLMAVLAVILFVRTYGRYTRWLAAIIFVTSFAIVYTVDPGIFGRLLQFAVREGLQQVR